MKIDSETCRKSPKSALSSFQKIWTAIHGLSRPYLLAKLRYLSLGWFLLILTGCASFSGRRDSSNAQSERDAIQFAATAYISAINAGDQQIQFLERSVRLSKRDMTLGSAGDREERLRLSDIDSIALYPGDVTHPNQLQLRVDRRLLVIQVMGSARSNDDGRTLQLYELLAINGVPRGSTEQFYFVGMDLEAAQKASGGDGFFAAAAGARFGSFVWDSIKGFGSLLVKPFIPLF